MTAPDVPWGRAWWDPDAAGEAAASFGLSLLKLLKEAYGRAGSPHGAPDADGEILRRWFDEIRETETGQALARELEGEWMFHLQVRFAARQVN